MNQNKIESIEIELLELAILKRYGYDFRNYARASFIRRIKQFQEKQNIKTISNLITLIIHDNLFFEKLLKNLSITVTEMYRDPLFFQSLKENVFPCLETYPTLKIWHAGCATGEEVYSLAILLKEANLLHKSRIYATDFNNDSIEKAKQGIYSKKEMEINNEKYIKAGGTKKLTDYYTDDEDFIIIDKSLRDKITFANHNLATDSSFGEMNLILCRNTMIYFDNILQNKVLKLFTESLDHLSFLGIGSKETLTLSNVEKQYKVIDKKWKIYKKN